MKPNATPLNVTGSLPAGGRKMFVDPKRLNKIMGLLIDLYADKEAAVLREISVNALDSHVMAGNPDPILVSTPSSLSPYFVVTDYGLGLSEAEVYELFGGYGSTTKDESNAVTGMLGLGSKSPLTYTNQFTMTAIKDGIKATVAIIRGEDGVGELNTVQSTPTDEPNGVSIKIPARTGNQLDEKARAFFAYWKPGTVLLNGKDPSGLGDVMEVSSDIYLTNRGTGFRSTIPTSVVVMGNVPYPAPGLDSTTLGVPYGYAVIAYVPIGAVDFAPSREALQDTKVTRETLDRVVKDFRAGLDTAVQRDIDAAPTGFEALQRQQRWRALYARQAVGFTYKGKPLPTSFNAKMHQVRDQYGYTKDVPQQKMLLMEKWGIYQQRGRQAERLSTVTMDIVLNSVFITNFDPEKPTPTHRKKATQWLSKQSFDVRYFVLLDFLPEGLDLVPTERVVDWSTIKAEKLPVAASASSTSSRIPGSFDIVLSGSDRTNKLDYDRIQYGVPGDKLDQTDPIYWYHGNTNDAFYDICSVLDLTVKKYTLICLPANRIEKFKRDNPKIENAQKVVEDKVKEIAGKMTPDEKKALYMHDHRLLELYAALDHKDILDPDIKELHRIATTNISKVLNARGQYKEALKLELVTTPVEDVMRKRYLLLDQNSLRFHRPVIDDHVVRYMNSEWQHLKKTAAKQAVSTQPDAV